MRMDKWLASCLVSGALLHWMVVISILLEPPILN